MDLKFSKYELILGVIMRLCGRYTKGEIAYLEKECNGPVLISNSEGYEGRYRSISQVQNLLKSWKNNKMEGISEQEINKLCDISHAMITDPDTVNSPEFGYEKVNINLSEERLSDLPVVSGCAVKSDKTFLGVTCTIDSGASSSACGVKLMKALGYEEKDLVPCPHIQVNTANSPCKPLGILPLRIYLKWKEQKFFYIKCNILVLSSNLNKLLIGIKDLYKANFSLDRDKITLDCYSPNHLMKRRVFKTSGRDPEGGYSTLTPRDSSGGNSTFSFESAHHLEMVGERWEVVVKKNPKNKKNKKKQELRIPISELILEENKVKDNKGNIEEVCFMGKVQMSGDLKDFGEGNSYYLEKSKKSQSDEKSEEKEIVKSVTQAVEDYQLYLAENERSNYKSFNEAQAEIEVVGNAEKELLNKMSLFPDGQEEEDKEYFVPDLSSMTDEWQADFRSLFSKYKNNFSKNKWDIAISHLPEVTLHSKPGEVACAPTRRYLEEELEIIDAYLEELEKKNLIRKMTPDEISPWNHNVHLVFRQVGGVKKFCNAQADRVSTEERLKMLRESARAVADVTEMNFHLLSHGQVYLPMIREILPYLGGKLASLTDIRSGFSTIRMDYQSCLKTAFTHRNVRYLHKVMIQGAKTSPLLYSLRMELVFNNESFVEFLKENAPDSNLVYSRSIIRYLDDILLICDTMEQMFLLWKYLMVQLDKWNVKIAKHKTYMCKSKFTFLGWDFIPHKNIYSMETQRRAALTQWEFQPVRAYVISRLATLNWNSNLIFGFKYLSQLLALLAQSKVMQVGRCHVKEWQMMLFVSGLVLHLYIPDLTKNLYISTDSSFSAAGALCFQYFPEKIYSTPEGIVWDKNDKGQNELKNKSGENVVLSRLEVVSMYSKRWGKQDIHKSIVYKESIALMCALKEYDLIIRSCTGKVILWTDASCLSFIHRLKSINSRIYSIALIVSSYNNLSIRFSKGGYLNFTSDLLSRILENNDIKFDAAIDPKCLEQIPTQFIDNTTISAETIHKICLSPLSPEFSALAIRKKQPFERVLSEDKMLELLKTNRLPEEDILNSICYGKDFINPNSPIFMSKKDKNIISQTEFDKLSSKMNFPAIKAEIMLLASHYSCKEDYESMQGLCKEFLTNLREFLVSETGTVSSELSSRISLALNQPNVTEEEFFDVLKMFQLSPAYNSDSEFNELLPSLFIPTFLEENSDIEIEFNEGALQLKAKESKTINQDDPCVFSVNLEFCTKYFFTIENQSDHLFYPVLKENYLSKQIQYLVVGCKAGQNITIEKNQILCKIIFHFGEENCNCISPQRVHYVLEKQSLISEKRDVQILLSELLTREMALLVSCHVCQISPCRCETQEVLLSQEQSDTRPNFNEHIELPQPRGLDIISNQDKNSNISYLNQLIVACLSFSRRNIFSPSHVQALQSSSTHLVGIRKLVQDGKTEKYFLFKDCLFYKGKYRSQLCLDDSTTKLLLDSLHQNGHHHSKDILLAHYTAYFRNKNEKKLVSESIENCSVCIFAKPCKKTNFVLNYSDELMVKPFQEIHLDLAEQICKSDAGFIHFILAIDRATNLAWGAPLKSTKSKEICEFVNNLISFLGIPKLIHSDMGACFASNDFQSLLQYYKINHVRSCSRSQSNGLCEEKIKSVRNKLKDIILHDSIERRRKWDIFFKDALILVNSSPPFAKFNNFSRYQLFFGANRFISGITFNLDCSLPMTDQQHQETLKKLHDFRLEYRNKFNHKINPFVIGQLCVLPKSKDELAIVESGKHLQATCQSIYRVIGLNRNSCRLLNLIDGSEISVDFGRLKSLSLGEIKGIFKNANWGRNSSFTHNLYKRNNGKTILETVEDLVKSSDISKLPLGGRDTIPIDLNNDTTNTSHHENLNSQTNWDETFSDTPSNKYDTETDDITTNDSPEEKLTQLAYHPYPPQLLDQWESEKLIPRKSDRNNRYPLRKRKPNPKYTDADSFLLKVSFNPEIQIREFDTPNDSGFDRRHKHKIVDNTKDYSITDCIPVRQSVAKRRALRLSVDISYCELISFK